MNLYGNIFCPVGRVFKMLLCKVLCLFDFS